MAENHAEQTSSSISLDGYSISPDALLKCLSMTFPPSMAQLVQELVAPVPDFDTIAKVLSSDPILSATVLTLVNSPYYGLNTKITDLQRAAVVLGTQEILKISLSISFHQNITKSVPDQYTCMYTDWRLVVWSSIAAEQIALHLAPEKAHLAYLSSLLKDLSLFLSICIKEFEGENECTTHSSEHAIIMLAQNQLEQEKEKWGRTHAEITSALLAEWNLPEELLEGICCHHDLEKLDTLSPLAQSVLLATRWSEVQHGPMPEAQVIIPFEVLIMRHLGISGDEFEKLRAECVQKFQSVLQLLAIEDAAPSMRYYRHSLQEMQGFYFNGVELANTSGGLDALALTISRQLRWNWGLENAELALQAPNTDQYQLFTIEEGTPPEPSNTLSPRKEVKWKIHGEKLLLGNSTQPYCEVHYLPVELSSTSSDSLKVFSSFLSQALNEYYEERAIMETKAQTLDTLPIGVAIINNKGHIIEGNDKFHSFLQLENISSETSASALLHAILQIPLESFIHQLTSSEERSSISQLYCTRRIQNVTKMPCIYCSLHKTSNANQLLLLLEDVTEITDFEIQILQQRDFFEQLVSSMREFLISVNNKGEIIWAAPSWSHLVGKNFFSIAEPSSAFAGLWDASLLTTSIPTAPVETTLTGTDGKQTQLELGFSPLGAQNSSEASVLIVGRDLTTIRRLEGEIRKQAMFDGLTGLLNHTHCKIVLEREVERSRRTGGAVGLLFFDLDNFKKVNDTYGHQAGDKVLKLTAQALSESLRKGMDFPCRYGGDEFAIITTEITPAELEKLGHRIQRAIQTNCKQLVSASIGIALLTQNETADQLLKRADNASYTAKSLGEGSVAWAEAAPESIR